MFAYGHSIQYRKEDASRVDKPGDNDIESYFNYLHFLKFQKIPKCNYIHNWRKTAGNIGNREIHQDLKTKLVQEITEFLNHLSENQSSVKIYKKILISISG